MNSVKISVSGRIIQYAIYWEKSNYGSSLKIEWIII